MDTVKAALALAGKNLLSWFRTPIHVLISFAPTIIVMILLSFGFAGSQTMPVLVVLDAPEDPLSQQFVNTVKDIRTAHFPWFEVITTDHKHAEEMLKDNKVLALIEVPDITSHLQSGENAEIMLHISNLNDDVTKNFRQRIQEACLEFDSRLQVSSTVQTTPPVTAQFYTFLPVDLPPLAFFGAGIVALAIIMGGINNSSVHIAREFEENTYKELVLSPGTWSILLGTLASSIIQTFLSVGLVWGLATVICQFIPQGSIAPLLFLILIGSFSFAGLGTLLGLYFKRVIPAAIVGVLIAIVGWFFGGIIWSDVWTGWVRGLIAVFPNSYLNRAFTRAALLGLYNTYWLDIGVLLLFGIVTGIAAYLLLKRKMAL
jgi:ABC-2 type transport system permease protein